MASEKNNTQSAGQTQPLTTRTPYGTLRADPLAADRVRRLRGTRRAGSCQQPLNFKEPMTRIQLSHQPEIYTGWDRQSLTYYLQVWENEDQPILEIGYKHKEITSIPELRKKAGEWEVYLSPPVTAVLRWHKGTNAGNIVQDLSHVAGLRA